MGRYIAKNIVAAGIVDELEIQLSYAIGVAQPVGIYVNSPGLGNKQKENISNLIQDVFDLTPAGIIDHLSLKQPIYQQTAALGHFGRQDVILPWEQLTMVNQLEEAVQNTVLAV